jgi:hypothetical protein
MPPRAGDGPPVRRCRRRRARPLADLSDFHPAELSDFQPALTHGPTNARPRPSSRLSPAETRVKPSYGLLGNCPRDAEAYGGGWRPGAVERRHAGRRPLAAGEDPDPRDTFRNTASATSEQFRSNNAQTPGNTRHHQAPEDEARHHYRRPCTVCKTSIPGSNPGGASIFPAQNRSSTSWKSQRVLSNWTTVDYKPAVRGAAAARKRFVRSGLVIRGIDEGGGSEDLTTSCHWSKVNRQVRTGKVRDDR